MAVSLAHDVKMPGHQLHNIRTGYFSSPGQPPSMTHFPLGFRGNHPFHHCLSYSRPEGALWVLGFVLSSHSLSHFGLSLFSALTLLPLYLKKKKRIFSIFTFFSRWGLLLLTDKHRNLENRRQLRWRCHVNPGRRADLSASYINLSPSGTGRVLEKCFAHQKAFWQ